MMRFPILLSALLLAPGLVASDAHAASRDDRKTLVVRGRVTDREGWPVPGAKVTSAGSHRASVNVVSVRFARAVARMLPEPSRARPTRELLAEK